MRKNFTDDKTNSNLLSRQISSRVIMFFVVLMISVGIENLLEQIFHIHHGPAIVTETCIFFLLIINADDFIYSKTKNFTRIWLRIIIITIITLIVEIVWMLLKWNKLMILASGKRAEVMANAFMYVFLPAILIKYIFLNWLNDKFKKFQPAKTK